MSSKLKVLDLVSDYLLISESPLQWSMDYLRMPLISLCPTIFLKIWKYQYVVELPLRYNKSPYVKIIDGLIQNQYYIDTMLIATDKFSLIIHKSICHTHRMSIKKCPSKQCLVLLIPAEPLVDLNRKTFKLSKIVLVLASHYLLLFGNVQDLQLFSQMATNQKKLCLHLE